MVTKEMICAAHDICLKKGDFVLSASLLERIYLAMRDKADGRDSAGWDAYEDLRKASDEMVLNLRQRVASPPGNGGRGLKHGYKSAKRITTSRIAPRQRGAWIETAMGLHLISETRWHRPPATGGVD